MIIKVQASSNVNTTDGSHIVNITNGKVDGASVNKMLEGFGFHLPKEIVETTINTLGLSISGTIGDATISFSSTPTPGKSFEFTCKIWSLNDEALDADFGIKFTIAKFPDPFKDLGEKMNASFEKIKGTLRPFITDETTLTFIVTILIAFLIALSIGLRFPVIPA